MSEDSLTVTDNRTGRTCELPILDGAVGATHLGQLRVVSYLARRRRVKTDWAARHGDGLPPDNRNNAPEGTRQ